MRRSGGRNVDPEARAEGSMGREARDKVGQRWLKGFQGKHERRKRRGRAEGEGLRQESAGDERKPATVPETGPVLRN